MLANCGHRTSNIVVGAFQVLQDNFNVVYVCTKNQASLRRYDEMCSLNWYECAWE